MSPPVVAASWWRLAAVGNDVDVRQRRRRRPCPPKTTAQATARDPAPARNARRATATSRAHRPRHPVARVPRRRSARRRAPRATARASSGADAGVGERAQQRLHRARRRRTRPSGRRRRRCSRPRAATGRAAGAVELGVDVERGEAAEHVEVPGLDDPSGRAASRPDRTPPRPRSGCATTAAPSARGRAPRGRTPRNTCSMSGSSPVVGSSSSSRSARLANAAISRTFCRLPWLYARIFLSATSSKRSIELVAVRVVDRAVDVAEEPQRLRAGERRPQVRLARHVREPPVDRRRVAPHVEIEDPRRTRRRAGSARAAARSSSTSRRRSARGSRTPRPLRSRGRAVERDHVPVALGQLLCANRDGHRASSFRHPVSCPHRP